MPLSRDFAVYELKMLKRMLFRMQVAGLVKTRIAPLTRRKVVDFEFKCDAQASSDW